MRQSLFVQQRYAYNQLPCAAGVILSGSPYSVYDDDAPHVDPAVFELGVPVLGICYGLQEMAWNMKGKVAKCDHREYGFATLEVGKGKSVDKLFESLGEEMQVWMSHGDQLSQLPPDFHIVGHTSTAPYAAIAHDSKPFWGIQFHPEVTHSPMGRVLIGKFILEVCGCAAHWTMVRPNIHYSYGFELIGLVGRVHWKGGEAYPRNGWTYRTSHRSR